MTRNKRTSPPAHGRSRKTPKINIVRYFQVLGISLSILLIGSLAAIGLFQYEDLGHRADPTTPERTTQVEGDKINVLLMCTDNEGLLTDAIMLASYDMTKNSLSILSIPRDTRIYIGNRYQKINAAHAYVDDSGNRAGAQGTVEAVTRLTGVPINYYVDFSFDTIARCVDALGPVEFEIPDLYNDGVGMVYDDPAQDLHIYLRPGMQELDGEHVVQLLRYRKGNPDENGHRNTYLRGDLDRIEIQSDFIKAFIDQKLNSALILKIPSLFKELSTGFETNLTAADVIKYRSCLSGFSADGLTSFTVPGVDEYIKEGKYDVAYFVPNLDELRKIIQDNFGYPADEITIDKEYIKPDNTPAPESTKKPQQDTEKDNDDDNNGENSSTPKKSNSSSSSSSGSSSSAATQKPSGASQSGSSSDSSGSSSNSGSSSQSGGSQPHGSSQSGSSQTGSSSQAGSSQSGSSQSGSSVTQSNTAQQKPDAPAKTETPVKKSAD